MRFLLIFQEKRPCSVILQLHVHSITPPNSGGNQTQQESSRQSSRRLLAAALLLRRAIFLPSETKHAKNNNPDADNEDQQYQLHLQIIPPHAIPQRPPLLVEIIRLKPQRLRLIHQHLNLLPSIQNFLDVIHHDFLHLADLLLHGRDFITPGLRAANAITTTTTQLLHRHRFFHLFFQRRSKRPVQTVRVHAPLVNRSGEFLREDCFHLLQELKRHLPPAIVVRDDEVGKTGVHQVVERVSVRVVRELSVRVRDFI